MTTSDELTVEKLLEAKRLMDKHTFVNVETSETELSIDKLLKAQREAMRDPSRHLEFPNNFSGIEVRVLHPYENRRRRRWKERLFSFPWRPWVWYDTAMRHSIDKGTMLYYKEQGVMFVRPDDYDRIKTIA